MENITINPEESKLEEIPKNGKKKVAIIIVISVIVALSICLSIIIINAISLKNRYNNAINFMNEGNYGGAISIFNKIRDYKDSEDLSRLCYKKCEKLISANIFNTIGIKRDGKAVFTGHTAAGLFGDSFDTGNWRNVIRVSSSSFNAIGLNKYGTIVGHDVQASEWKDLIDIENADMGDLFGLKNDGTVVSNGMSKKFASVSTANYYGQSEISDWEDIVSISASSCHTVGLRSDGTVIAIGLNDDGQCNVGEWSDIIAISAGNTHTVGLKSDGTVVAVGSNNEGECNVSDWRDIVVILADSDRTFGVKSDGTVVVAGSIGDKGQGDVGGWNDIIAISASMNHTVGLKSDGSVVATGDNNSGQCNVEDWNLFE